MPRSGRWLYRFLGAKNVVGISPGQPTHLAGLAVTGVPALHLALGIGYVLESGEEQVYFSGDTFYGSFMKEIGRRFHLTAALMPVTTFRIPMTMGEAGAVRATQAMHPAVVIPIHLGIRPRSPLLRTGQSPEGFIRRLRKAGSQTQITVLREGESWESAANQAS